MAFINSQVRQDFSSHLVRRLRNKQKWGVVPFHARRQQAPTILHQCPRWRGSLLEGNEQGIIPAEEIFARQTRTNTGDRPMVREMSREV